jgi:two-component system chemotaxis response regulator CheV
MATAIRPTSDKGILLESGTNEVEILVFRIGRQRCGVNVAKVREVRTVEPTTVLPNYPDAIHGVIRIRESVIPLVDLHKHLWGPTEDRGAVGEDADLLLEFNDRLIAFRVQGIERIFRVSWKDLIPLPECPGLSAPLTGVMLLEGQLVALLDFESIGAVLGINGDARIAADNASTQPATRATCPIVYADDSQLIRRMLDDALTQAGYQNIHGFSDGQEAWEYLAGIAEGSSPQEIRQKVACVVSDIEMPRMDGLTLTRRIRDHAVLEPVPVVLFSSLISKDNEKKGRQVGATAQISKPKWEDLTKTVTEMLETVIG